MVVSVADTFGAQMERARWKKTHFCPDCVCRSTVSTRVQDASFCPENEHQNGGCVLYMGMRFLFL